MEGWALGGWLGQPGSVWKVTTRSSCHQEGLPEKQLIQPDKDQEPEEKAGSDRQNSVNPGAEPAHANFINNKVIRKRLYRGQVSLRRKEVEDHR